MRIFAPEPVIGPNDGFSPDVDIFKRADLGDGLTNLVTQVQDPMVIALDASWGSGKTTFLKMWAGHLRNQGHLVIYFDAFAHDYAADPFVPLAGQIIELTKSSNAPEAETFKGRAVDVGKMVLKGAAKVIVKAGVTAATGGLVSAEGAGAVAQSLISDAADEAGTLTDKYVGELLQESAGQSSTMLRFHQSLQKLASEITSEGNAPRNLVFIIDELDRCTPTFALSLLERVKHFFSVPKVHFVLGVQMTQLRNSVRAAYGTDVDAVTYLQKFIHVTVPLVDAPEYESESVITKFVDHLAAILKPPPWAAHEAEMTKEFIIAHARATGMTLRAVERIYTTLALSFVGRTENTLCIAPLVAGLAILKLDHPELYVKAKTGALTFDEVKSVLHFKRRPEETEEESWSRGWWQFATDPNCSPELVKEFGQGLWRYSTTRARLLPFIANSVVDRFVPRSGS